MDKKSNEVEVLYKYKSLKDLKPILDMIVLNKIYGAKYEELNDPMEGAFMALIDDESEEEIKKIGRLKEAKQKSRICSFSKSYNNAMMWAHYADGFHGCCIGVEVKARAWKRTEVAYNDALIQLKPQTCAEDIFANKQLLWKYEEEVRYIKTQKEWSRKDYFFNVNVREIYFGISIDTHIENIITKIACALKPELKNKIRRIQKDELVFYNN